MKTKYRAFSIAVFAALLMVFGLSCASLANERRYIIDNVGVLTDTELVSLSDHANNISRKHRVDVGFFLADSDYAPDKSLIDYTKGLYIEFFGYRRGGFLQAYDIKNTQWALIHSIIGTQIYKNSVIDTFKDAFRNGFAAENSYHDAIMAYLDAADAYIASELDTVSGRFIDNIRLLTQAQAKELTAKLDEISERHQHDTVVGVVRRSPDGKAPAEDFYKKNRFGFGRFLDGTALLFYKEPREGCFLSVNGLSFAFTNAGKEYLEERVNSHLKSNNHFEFFMAYADIVDDFFTKDKAGERYDKGNIPWVNIYVIIYFTICGLAPILVAALIFVETQRSRTKTAGNIKI